MFPSFLLLSENKWLAVTMSSVRSTIYDLHYSISPEFCPNISISFYCFFKVYEFEYLKFLLKFF